MITDKQAKKEIENHFDYCGFDKSKINRAMIQGFVEMCNNDYEEWIKQMLGSYFNDNGQKSVGGKFFFEKEVL